MHLSLSPLSKSKRKRAEREVEARLASPPARNGRSRRRGAQDARPGGGPERSEASVAALRSHPYVVECSHPLNRVVARFATSDYITGERFVVGFCHNCRLHVTTPAPGEVD